MRKPKPVALSSLSTTADDIIAAEAPTTIDDLLVMLKRCGKRYYGYALHNLFELPDGSWRANVRHGESYYEFGTGGSAFAALEDAFRKALDGNPGHPVELLADALHADDDEDLIG